MNTPSRGNRHCFSRTQSYYSPTPSLHFWCQTQHQHRNLHSCVLKPGSSCAGPDLLPSWAPCSTASLSLTVPKGSSMGALGMGVDVMPLWYMHINLTGEPAFLRCKYILKSRTWRKQWEDYVDFLALIIFKAIFKPKTPKAFSWY